MMAGQSVSLQAFCTCGAKLPLQDTPLCLDVMMQQLYFSFTCYPLAQSSYKSDLALWTDHFRVQPFPRASVFYQSLTKHKKTIQPSAWLGSAGHLSLICMPQLL